MSQPTTCLYSFGQIKSYDKKKVQFPYRECADGTMNMHWEHYIPQLQFLLSNIYYFQELDTQQCKKQSPIFQRAYTSESIRRDRQ